MPLILAVEPDSGQAAAVRRAVHGLADVELVLVDSKAAALATLSKTVPELILLSAILSPSDESALTEHLRRRSDADHVQMITIPLLDGPPHRTETKSRGLFGMFKRRGRQQQDNAGRVSPRVFAGEIKAHLERARDAKDTKEARAARALATKHNHVQADTAELAVPAVPAATRPATAEPAPQFGGIHWSGFSDDFGERYASVDVDGSYVELLRLVPAFTAAEGALSDRIARLMTFDRSSVTRALRLERDVETERLILVSDRAAGVRLPELLGRATLRLSIPDIPAALFVMQRLLLTAGALHKATGVAHITLRPERIVITPRGEVVVVEAALAGAIEATSSSSPWPDDPRSDIAATALVGISMMLGYAIDGRADVDARIRLLDDVADVATIRAGERFATSLRSWFTQALGSDVSQAFPDFQQAALALEHINAAKDGRCVARRQALKTFLKDLADFAPDEVALEANRVRSTRTRLIARRSVISEAPSDVPTMPVGAQTSDVEHAAPVAAAEEILPVFVERTETADLMDQIFAATPPKPTVTEEVAAADVKPVEEVEPQAPATAPDIFAESPISIWREPIDTKPPVDAPDVQGAATFDEMVPAFDKHVVHDTPPISTFGEEKSAVAGPQAEVAPASVDVQPPVETVSQPLIETGEGRRQLQPAEEAPPAPRKKASLFELFRAFRTSRDADTLGAPPIVVPEQETRPAVAERAETADVLDQILAAEPSKPTEPEEVVAAAEVKPVEEPTPQPAAAAPEIFAEPPVSIWREPIDAQPPVEAQFESVAAFDETAAALDERLAYETSPSSTFVEEPSVVSEPQAEGAPAAVDNQPPIELVSQPPIETVEEPQHPTEEAPPAGRKRASLFELFRAFRQPRAEEALHVVPLRVPEIKNEEPAPPPEPAVSSDDVVEEMVRTAISLSHAPAEPTSPTEEEASEIFATAATPEIVEPIAPSIVEQPPAAEPFAWEAGSSQPVTESAAEPSAEIWPEPIDTQPTETSATLEAAPTLEEEAPEPGDTEPPVDLREEGAPLGDIRPPEDRRKAFVFGLFRSFRRDRQQRPEPVEHREQLTVPEPAEQDAASPEIPVPEQFETREPPAVPQQLETRGPAVEEETPQPVEREPQSGRRRSMLSLLRSLRAPRSTEETLEPPVDAAAQTPADALLSSPAPTMTVVPQAVEQVDQDEEVAAVSSASGGAEPVGMTDQELVESFRIDDLPESFKEDEPAKVGEPRAEVVAEPLVDDDFDESFEIDESTDEIDESTDELDESTDEFDESTNEFDESTNEFDESANIEEPQAIEEPRAEVVAEPLVDDEFVESFEFDDPAAIEEPQAQVVAEPPAPPEPDLPDADWDAAWKAVSRVAPAPEPPLPPPPAPRAEPAYVPPPAPRFPPEPPYRTFGTSTPILIETPAIVIESARPEVRPADRWVPPQSKAPVRPRRWTRPAIVASLVAGLALAGSAYYFHEPIADISAARDAEVVPPVKPSIAKGAKPKARGSLAVASVPSGANVLVDGKRRGVTPLSIPNLTVGSHTVVLESSAGTVRRVVKIEADGEAALNELIFSGWVAVFAPFELEIADGNRVIGTTESGKIMLPPGRHALVLTNAGLGYRESRTVEIEPGATATVNITGAKGILRISTAAGAEVWVDGQRIGDTPIADVEVPIGTREIVVRHPQLGERRVTTTVTQSAPAEVTIDFGQRPSLGQP